MRKMRERASVERWWVGGDQEKGAIKVRTGIEAYHVSSREQAR